jgi:hypothetical protein
MIIKKFNLLYTIYIMDSRKEDEETEETEETEEEIEEEEETEEETEEEETEEEEDDDADAKNYLKLVIDVYNKQQNIIDKLNIEIIQLKTMLFKK